MLENRLAVLESQKYLGEVREHKQKQAAKVKRNPSAILEKISIKRQVADVDEYFEKQKQKEHEARLDEEQKVIRELDEYLSFEEKAWIDINKRISDDFGQASHFDDYFDEKFIQISRKTIQSENEFAQMNMKRRKCST